MSVVAYSPFTPDVLDSYDRFRDFFAQNKAIEEIRKESENPLLHKTGNLANRWQVAALKVSAPFAYVYTVFTRAISKLLFSLGLTTWAIQVAVNSKLWEKDRRLMTCRLFGDHCLAFTTNARAQNSWDVYLQAERPVETIGSKKVQDLVDSRNKKLVFFNDVGCCRGISEWFLYLYFKTRPLFSDPEAHVSAIGRRFTSGAPREAVLLQAMCHHDRRFLGMEREGERIDVYKARTQEDNHTRITTLFKKLDPGAYAIGTAFHRMNYISLGGKKGFLFDPTHGVIAIKGAKDIAKLADKMLQYTREGQPRLLELEKIVPA